MTARRARRAPEPGQKWTRRQMEALGTRYTLAEAGSIIAGLSETSSRELYHRGEFPVPVIKVGRRLIVPAQPVLALLGLDGGGSDICLPAADQDRGGGGARPGTAGERRGGGDAA